MTHSLLIVLSVLFIIQALETFLALFQQSVSQYHQRVQRMAAPPPYDDSQKYNPGQGPPGYYPQQPGPPGRAPAVNLAVVNQLGMGGLENKKSGFKSKGSRSPKVEVAKPLENSDLDR